LKKFNCFVAELFEQFLPIGHNDSGGASVPLLPDDDRVPAAGLHPAQPDPVRRVPVELSGFRSRQCPQRLAHSHLRLVRHLLTSNWHYNQVIFVNDERSFSLLNFCQISGSLAPSADWCTSSRCLVFFTLRRCASRTKAGGRWRPPSLTACSSFSAS
jgi:hypothetical protein